MIEELTPQEGRKIYKFCAPLDFPKSELKPVNIVYRLLKRGDYHAYAYKVPTEQVLKGEFRAYAYVLQGDGAALLDYYAVFLPHRGAGNGSNAIKEIAAAVDGHLVFEVERPELAQTPEEETTRRRRIDFYLRNGAHITDVCTELFTVPFRIMYFGDEMSEYEVQEKVAMLYDRMFGAKIAARYSKIFVEPEI